MIHLVENHYTHPDRRLVETMFEDRKRLFVDLFGWEVPVIDGRFEMDEFDRADTIYVIAANADGTHAASMRLMPSTRPHLLGCKFAHLCPGGVPVDQSTWESARLCLPQRHGAELRRQLRNALISAMIDFALGREIDRFTGVIPENFRKEVLSMGWLAEALGPAVHIPGGPVGAFAIHVRPDTPDRLRWTGVYVPDMLHASPTSHGRSQRSFAEGAA